MAAIEVIWKKMGSEFKYTIMYAKDENGPWIKAHSFRLTDALIDWRLQWLDNEDADPATASYRLTGNNVFVINGLREDEQYFIKVLSDDKYHLWWYSYVAEGSLEGGLDSETRPVPNDGNSIGFQFEVL